MLDKLHTGFLEEQKAFLKKNSVFGRALTGDGATILGSKFVNFLAHQYGIGVMLITIKDCTERLQEVGTIDAAFISHLLLEAIRFVHTNTQPRPRSHLHTTRTSTVGPKTVYLVITDGGPDWVATQWVVQEKYPWIHFIHCVSHECSLIVKDICKINPIQAIVTWITDAQHWFSTAKTGPLLQRFCQEHYNSSRAFIWPAETRFAGKLLQIKRFLDMRDALQSCVQSAQYKRFDFADDTFSNRILGNRVWSVMERITKFAGPILLLLRLADSNYATLTKLKGTVDYVAKKLPDSGTDTLEDQIAVAFKNRVLELDSDIATAAWIIDPQFVNKSRQAESSIMTTFWGVCRKVLRVRDEGDWSQMRGELLTQLSRFRLKQGGFSHENYDVADTCAFWVVAGCHAPGLQKLAMCLAPLPCSSGEAERTWFLAKESYTKKRNRLNRQTLEKMIFVRRFIRLKRALCLNDSVHEFNDWTKSLLDEVAAASESSTTSDSEIEMDRSVFKDFIEPGEQGRINGREPGAPVVSLTDLRKNQASKSWLFEKYYNLCFLDKNPEGNDGDPPLENESQWEHRIIKNIVWWRRNGFSVESCLYGTHESIDKYLITPTLHEMIRDSPHNTCEMYTQIERTDDDAHDGGEAVEGEEE